MVIQNHGTSVMAILGANTECGVHRLDFGCRQTLGLAQQGFWPANGALPATKCAEPLRQNIG